MCEAHSGSSPTFRTTNSHVMIPGIALCLLCLHCSCLAQGEVDDTRTEVTAQDSLRLEDREHEVETDSLQAREKQQQKVEATLSLELSGFIVDETQTKIGRDFYEMFFAQWSAPEHVTEYTIMISERPMPQRGTQISVTVNDYEIFQSFLQPRLEAIEEMAMYAVQQAMHFLSNYQNVVRELQGGDMQGSGIF